MHKSLERIKLTVCTLQLLPDTDAAMIWVRSLLLSALNVLYDQVTGIFLATEPQNGGELYSTP